MERAPETAFEPDASATVGSPMMGPGRDRAAEPDEVSLERRIAQLIITKEFRPGQRLREAALASRFKVSRAKVRQACIKLSSLGVVHIRHNYGAVVCLPSPEEARAVFRVRKVLEEQVIREVIERSDPGALARLKESVREERCVYETRRHGLAQLSSKFHMLLSEATGNALLTHLMEQVIYRCVLIQCLYERPDQETVCLVHDHEELIETIKSKDIGLAAAKSTRHIEAIENSLRYKGDFEK